MIEWENEILHEMLKINHNYKIYIQKCHGGIDDLAHQGTGWNIRMTKSSGITIGSDLISKF